LSSTFDRLLLQLLTNAGCYLVRQGRHPMWFSPVSGLTFPVPSGIKSRHTANEVLKQAGLPKAF
jgi:hypothetical protein